MNPLASISSHQPCDHHCGTREDCSEKAISLFMGRSVQTQLADSRLLPLLNTIGRRVLTGLLPSPEFGTEIRKPFTGTCNTLTKIIHTTVEKAVAKPDYNGLQPFLKLLNQIDKGKSFSHVSIDSVGEENGTTCVGFSHAILQALKTVHGIEGTSAFVTNTVIRSFGHAVVIVECTDGYVLIESTENPILTSIPFGQTRPFHKQYITASTPGALIPLTAKEKGRSTKHGEIVWKFCTRFTTRGNSSPCWNRNALFQMVTPS